MVERNSLDVYLLKRLIDRVELWPTTLLHGRLQTIQNLGLVLVGDRLKAGVIGVQVA